MKTALIFAALLMSSVVLVWLASRKAARVELELKYAKERARREANAAEVLAEYINLDHDQLNERVRKKREAAKQCLRNKD